MLLLNYMLCVDVLSELCIVICLRLCLVIYSYHKLMDIIGYLWLLSIIGYLWLSLIKVVIGYLKGYIYDCKDCGMV